MTKKREIKRIKIKSSYIDSDLDKWRHNVTLYAAGYGGLEMSSNWYNSDDIDDDYMTEIVEITVPEFIFYVTIDEIERDIRKQYFEIMKNV